MSTKEFNRKYGISDALASYGLVRHINSGEKNFNNVAGKPKKLIVEIFKRFFTNWAAVLCLIIFSIVLLTAVIVTLSSPFSAELPINKTYRLWYQVHDSSAWEQTDPSPYFKKLPPIYSPFVERENLFSKDDVYKQYANGLINSWNGIAYTTFLQGQFTGSSLENAETINAYAFYKASSLVMLLEKAGVRQFADPNWTSGELNTWKNDIQHYTELFMAKNNNFDINTFLGTSTTGVDFWTQSWIGTLKALRLAFIVAIVQTLIGVAVGAYLGFHAGSNVDTIIMRLIDIFTAPPTLIWLLLFASTFGTSDLTLGLALIFVGWTGSVGGTRMYIITVKDSEFITASKSIGASKARLIYKHALPAIIGKIATSFVHTIPSIIMSVSSLAFLGFFESNSANLGAILSKNVNEAKSNIWALALPAFILLSISVSLHFVALGIHDALDPKVIKTR